MTVRDDYPAIAVLHDAWLDSGRNQPEAVRAFIEIAGLRERCLEAEAIAIDLADQLRDSERQSELLAAALLTRGVEAKDCDALDRWLMVDS